MLKNLTVRGLLPVAVVLAALAVTGTARAQTPDSQLLQKYQPVTVFDPSERFRPTSVQSFIADAELEQLIGGSWTVVDPDPEPGELPGPGTGTWRLDQASCTTAAPLGGLSCYADAAGTDSGGNTVYGRVVRSEDAVVVEYWFFYYDDVYSYFYPPSDVIWQAHEGDWEAVGVVLTPDEEPIAVGYSQHCLGERRAWAATRKRDDTHPVVYVAAGSHANYFAPGVHPFDTRCVPPAALALLRQHGLPLPTDAAGVGDMAGPPGSGAEPMTIKHTGDGTHGWLTFPGFWGEGEYLHSPFTGTLLFGVSPVGPAYHALWNNPLATLASWNES